MSKRVWSLEQGVLVCSLYGGISRVLRRRSDTLYVQLLRLGLEGGVRGVKYLMNVR